jgi:uncharacterized damage-inducible protein DinB
VGRAPTASRFCIDATSSGLLRSQPGLPFKSALGTMNHIVAADWLWYGRLTGAHTVGDVPLASLIPCWNGKPEGVLTKPFRATVFTVTVVASVGRLAWGFTDWEKLFESLEDCDVEAEKQNLRWLEFVDALSDDDLQATFEYNTTDGYTKRAVRQHMLLHVFNHATHHRFVSVELW